MIGSSLSSFHLLLITIVLLVLLVFFVAPRIPHEHSTQGKLSAARAFALDVLVRRSRAGDIVVFDFDDTLFDPDKVVDVTHMDVSAYANTAFGPAQQAVPLYAPIEPMMDVLRFALSQGLDVVVLTARTHDRRMLRTVSENLRRQGIRLSDVDVYDARNARLPTTSCIIGRRAGLDDRSSFKAQVRRRISQSWRVVLTIGDRWADVDDPGDAAWVKLPAKDDPIMQTSR